MNTRSRRLLVVFVVLFSILAGSLPAAYGAAVTGGPSLSPAFQGEPPRRCDPEGDPDLVPLADYLTEEGTWPIVVGEEETTIFYMLGTYIDPDGHEFYVFIASTEEDQVREYVARGSTCFEALPDFDTPVETNPFDDEFYRIMTETLGRREIPYSEFLQILRMEMAAGALDCDWYADEVRQRAFETVAVMLERGELDEEVAGDIYWHLDSFSCDALLDEVPVEVDNLAIYFAWTNPEAFGINRNAYVVHFIFDPIIRSGNKAHMYFSDTTRAVATFRVYSGTIRAWLSQRLYDSLLKPVTSARNFSGSSPQSLIYPSQPGTKLRYFVTIQAVSSVNEYWLSGSLWYRSQ